METTYQIILNATPEEHKLLRKFCEALKEMGMAEAGEEEVYVAPNLAIGNHVLRLMPILKDRPVKEQLA